MKKNGFTLFETVFIIAFYIITLLALTNLFISFTRLYSYQQTFIPTVQSASALIDAVTASATLADHIVASHTFAGTLFTTGTSTLVLELPAVDLSGSIITGVYDYVAFSTTTSALYRRTDTGAGSARTPGTKLLGRDATALIFTYDNTDLTKAGSVTTDISTQSMSGQQTIRDHIHKQTSLRNF